MKNYKGFSLIELAIALVIIGVLFTAGASLLKNMSRDSVLRQAREELIKTDVAITAYVRFHGYLPDKDQFKNDVAQIQDSYGGDYIYVFAKDLTDTGADRNIDDLICKKRATGLIIKICENEGCSDYQKVNNAAYLIASPGEDRTEQIRVTGTEDLKTAEIPKIDKDFDDVFRWRSLSELKNDLGCSDKPLKILNNELPPLQISGQYPENRLFPEGGIPYTGNKYDWCVSSEDPQINIQLDFRRYPTSGSDNVTISPVNKDCDNSASWSQGRMISVIPAPGASPTDNSTQLLFNVYVKDREGNAATKRFLQILY